ncbi:D-2-hydroxyacid dehydrogenase [Paenarthrobacter sp. NPDC058040]|uniref:D-2-hydroxyacid dehydrogenase n=1 Tax=unclassified Paenarthrobacter TaxID=2634190 RepID=UPI0036DEB4F9
MRRIKVHMENVGSLREVYDITPERVKTALEPYGDLADHLDIRIGTDSDFDEILQDTEVLYGSLMGRELPRDLLAKAPNLKWVNYIGAGIDHLLPLNWLPEGAVLTKSSGAHMPIAAEYGLMGLFMLNNFVPAYTSNQREHKWERYFATPLQGKTLGVVGVGHIGAAIAGLARQHGMKTLGVRRTAEGHPNIDEMFGPDGLDTVLQRSDFIVVGVASTEQTRGLIGQRELQLLKPGAGIVSYARGDVIDWDALREQLTNGHLSGAVVNGLPQEPLPESSPLWDTPNLVITQHTGTQDDDQYMIQCLDILFRNMRRYIDGDQLLFQSDPAIGY